MRPALVKQGTTLNERQLSFDWHSVITSYDHMSLTNWYYWSKWLSLTIKWPIHAQFYWANTININTLIKDFCINTTHKRSITSYNVEKLTIKLMYGGLENHALLICTKPWNQFNIACDLFRLNRFATAGHNAQNWNILLSEIVYV